VSSARCTAWVGPVRLDGPLTFETACFSSISVTATVQHAASETHAGARGANSSLSLSFTTRAHTAAHGACEDLFVLTTLEGVHVEVLTAAHTTRTLLWGGLTLRALEDVRASGVRLFRCARGVLGTLASAFETALLFAQPMSAKRVSRSAAERNIRFLRDHMGPALGAHAYERRNVTTVTLREAEVADGDMLCIMRLDGLDPFINWFTGGSCGHSVMALRLGGVLHVIESQSGGQGAYWPKNFVQRTRWEDWLRYADAASFNVLHLRLSAASRARFNASAAAATFARDYEGLLYGTANMLWGALDGPTDNFPEPLDVRLAATLMSTFDPLLTALMGEATPSLWDGAIAHRLGLDPAMELSTAQMLGLARARNVSFADLLRMPERDAWVYPVPDGACGRTVGCSGSASVCNVFVCKMWKAGGLFDTDFECGEQTPLDTYGMDLFDLRPTLSPACRAADPMNTAYCQILGDYRIDLTPHLSSVKPHIQMANACPSKAPDYLKRFDPKVAATC